MSFFGGIKRTTGDAAFSDYVRSLAGWVCEWPGCGRDFTNNHQGLHCSHFHTRANPRVRFDLSNAAALCAYHHDYVGKHPHEHVEYFKQRLGALEYDMLTVRANSRRKERLDHKFEAIRWRKALEDLDKGKPEVMGARA